MTIQFSQPVSKIIQQRYSCRKYQDTPIPIAQTRILEKMIETLKPGPFGSSARFKLVAATDHDRTELRGLGTYGFIRGATGFIIGTCQDRNKNLEDFGYQMENLILLATDLGLGTCWLGGTFTRRSFANKIKAFGGEIIPAVTAVGQIADQVSRLEQIIRWQAGSDHRLPWGKLFFNRQFNQPLTIQDAGSYSHVLEMVRLGPSASNKQPWRIIKENQQWHFYLHRTKGYGGGKLSRVIGISDIQRLDMGIAMCHFELSALEGGLRGKWEERQPAITKPGELCEYLVTWVGDEMH